MFQLATFHGIIGRAHCLYADYDDDDEKNVTAIQRFGGILAKQLVLKARGLDERRRQQLRARMNCLGGGMDDFISSQESIKYVDDDDDDDCGMAVAEDEEMSTISGIGSGSVDSSKDEAGQSNDSGIMSKSNKRGRNTMLVDSMVDRLGNVHQAVKNPWKLQVNGGRMGKGYTPAYPCCQSGCKKRSRVHCYQCNKVFCFRLINDVEDKGSTGMIVGGKESCFSKHVHQIRRKSGR
jgi:hypothetical protein